MSEFITKASSCQKKTYIYINHNGNDVSQTIPNGFRIRKKRQAESEGDGDTEPGILYSLNAPHEIFLNVCHEIPRKQI